MSKYAPQHSACRHAAHGNRQRISSGPWLGRGRYLSAGGVVGFGFFNPSPRVPAADLSARRCIISANPEPSQLVVQHGWSKGDPNEGQVQHIDTAEQDNDWMNSDFLIKMQPPIHPSIYVFIYLMSQPHSPAFFQTVTQFSSKSPLNLFN